MADGMIAVAGTVVAPGDIVADGIVVVTASGVQSLDSGLSTAAGVEAAADMSADGEIGMDSVQLVLGIAVAAGMNLDVRDVVDRPVGNTVGSGLECSIVLE